METGNMTPSFLAEFYEKRFGRSELEALIENIYFRHSENNTNLLESICRSSIKIIITSNIDNDLEKACDKIYRKYHVFTPDNLDNWNSTEELKIFKICGNIGGVQILTENDFRSYADTFPHVHSLLQSVFYLHGLLFIGCSMKDVYFRKMINTVKRKKFLVKNILQFYQIILN